MCAKLTSGVRGGNRGETLRYLKRTEFNHPQIGLGRFEILSRYRCQVLGLNCIGFRRRHRDPLGALLGWIIFQGVLFHSVRLYVISVPCQ